MADHPFELHIEVNEKGTHIEINDRGTHIEIHDSNALQAQYLASQTRSDLQIVGVSEVVGGCVAQALQTAGVITEIGSLGAFIPGVVTAGCSSIIGRTLGENVSWSGKTLDKHVEDLFYDLLT